MRIEIALYRERNRDVGEPPFRTELDLDDTDPNYDQAVNSFLDHVERCVLWMRENTNTGAP